MGEKIIAGHSRLVDGKSVNSAAGGAGQGTGATAMPKASG
jgi:hypothetical protein